MFRKVTLLYCLILCTTETFGRLELIRALFEVKDQNVARVRTVEELKARKNENVVLDFVGLVQQYKGYTAEEYDVQTDDGYILKLHRITGSPRRPAASGKPVVFIQHSHFTSSDFHVFLGPQQALTFLLADEGYDIWLGNVRGTSYSKRHVKLSSSCNNYNFWNFSLDEFGTIDLPKFIDTVLEKTNKKNLTYIGYSMGTTMSYMLLAEKPEYNSKMNLVISLAPVAFYNPPYSDLINRLIVVEPAIKAFVEFSQCYELLPQTKILHNLDEYVCDSRLGQIFCGTFLFPIVNPKNLNFTVIPHMLDYVPAGSSFRSLEQYYQMATTHEFKKSDYGILANQVKYGSSRPPKYELSKVTAPQAIYYADNDALTSAKGIKKLRDTLKNVVVFQQAPAGYNHLDFLMSMDVREVLYVQILDTIKKFNY